MSQHLAEWEQIQNRAFTRWVAAHLKKRGLTIENMAEEFKDGVKLIHLYEIISDQALGKFVAQPRLRVQQIANLNIVINEINKFVESVGIKTKYSAEQIVDGQIKFILGMIWCLIHKFEIQDISEDELTARDGLLLWCQRKTAGYPGVHVDNFNTSWQDGLAFAALIHKHRPDLLDFDSFPKENRLENLRRVFEIAEKQLDIPALLDPEDLINTARPDDKAVMTYVAYFWKKFSAGKTAEQAGKKIGKLVQRQLSIEQMEQDYERRAAELAQWIADSTALLDNSDYGNSLQAVQDNIKKFNGWKNSEKPTRTAERLDLQALLTQIRSKQKASGLPTYNPPEHLTTANIAITWDELSGKERQYDLGLRAELARQKRLDMLLNRFKSKVKKLNNWGTEKETYLREEPNAASISEAEAAIKILEAYESEYRATKPGFAQSEAIGQQIIEAKHAESEFVEQSIAALKELDNVLVQLSEELKQKLHALLEQLKATEGKSLLFASKAEEYNLWAEDVLLVLSDPVYANNVADVESQQEVVNKFDEEQKTHDATINELNDINNELAAAGVTKNRYSRFTAQALSDKHADVRAQLDARIGELDAEKTRQTHNAELLNEFNAAAHEFSEFVNEAKAAIGEDVAGTVEEQLQKVNSQSVDILHKAAEKLQHVKQLNGKLEQADIADLAPTPIQEILIQNDQLENFIKKRRDSLEDQLLSAKAMEVSEDQLKELQNVFKHFDKDKDGTLNKPELRAALTSLEFDFTDQQLDEVLRQLDTNHDGLVEINEFIGFVASRLKEGESAEDMLKAFETLAGGNAFISEGQLRSAVSKEQGDYLLSRMPHSDSGYDYKAYLHALFGAAA